MSWNPDIPYNALPTLPPRCEIETKAVLKQCVKSRTAVERINQSVEHLPNPSLLINILPLLEARASSEIENIVVIKGCEMKVRSVPGTTLRNEQTRTTIYTPPVGSDLIREKLANWEQFIHGTLADYDPLVVIAVAHYQFEAIHPFTDGNGRTGRVLNLLQLVSSDLLQLPILYHSRSIIYSVEFIDVLFNQPYCRIQDVVEAGIAKRQSASVYLKELVDYGILAEEKIGREKLFVHKRYLNLLLNEDA